MELFDLIKAKDAKTKYSAYKELILMSKNSPEKIYPYFDIFVELLDNENNVVKWNAIIILGNLAKVDSSKKIIKVLPKLYEMLNCGVMITANNTIQSLSQIFKSLPEKRDEILDEILKVEHYKYKTDECNAIACGKLLEIFTDNIAELKTNPKIIEFIDRQINSQRPATSKKAQTLLKLIAVQY